MNERAVSLQLYPLQPHPKPFYILNIVESVESVESVGGLGWFGLVWFCGFTCVRMGSPSIYNNFFITII